VLLSSPVLAEPPAPAPEGSKNQPTQLPEVKVTAPARLPGDPLPLSSVPATVDIVPGDRLRATGAVSLQEALTRLPGVNLTDQQGNSWQMDLSFRGFRSSSVTGESQGLSVFVDGVRVNEPTVEEVNFDLIPLDEIERIEVIRGPAAGSSRQSRAGASAARSIASRPVARRGPSTDTSPVRSSRKRGGATIRRRASARSLRRSG
jgi:outer membrane cobalamin receptor